jgi:lysophospholipase L1-like esterase
MPVPAPCPNHRSILAYAFVALIAALTLFALSAPADGHAKSSSNSKATRYMALGDSLTFGYQQAKYNALLPAGEPAKAFKTGFVDVFSKRLKKARGRVITSNLGCPGETTDSLLGLAPCPYHPPFPLHVAYPGSQMAAALAIAGRKNKPNVITVDIGNNDLLATVNGCNANPAPYPSPTFCILARAPDTFAHVIANQTTILTQLRAAAPKAKIVNIGVYNPLTPTLGVSSDVLARNLNGQLLALSTSLGAKFADPMNVFNPSGDNEIPTLCALTAVCGPLKDIHPTDAGYKALGNLAYAAAGIKPKKQKKN